MISVEEGDSNPGVHPEVDERVDTGVSQGQEQEHCVDVANNVAGTGNTFRYYTFENLLNSRATHIPM